MMKQAIRSSLSQLRTRGMPVLLASGVLLMAGCASVPAPTAQMAVSKAAVQHADTAGTTEFAPVELQSAKDKLARAEKAMAQENYELAKQLADEAQADARLAEAKSETAQAQKAAQDSQAASRALRQEINRQTQ
jgi:hypothetical protein